MIQKCKFFSQCCRWHQKRPRRFGSGPVAKASLGVLVCRGARAHPTCRKPESRVGGVGEGRGFDMPEALYPTWIVKTLFRRSWRTRRDSAAQIAIQKKKCFCAIQPAWKVCFFFLFSIFEDDLHKMIITLQLQAKCARGFRSLSVSRCYCSLQRSQNVPFQARIELSHPQPSNKKS